MKKKENSDTILVSRNGLARGLDITKAVRQVLALAVFDGGQATTRAAAIVCERALKTLED